MHIYLFLKCDFQACKIQKHSRFTLELKIVKAQTNSQGYDDFRDNFPKLLLRFPINVKVSLNGHDFENGRSFKAAGAGPRHEDLSIHTLPNLLAIDQTAVGKIQSFHH